MDALVTSSRGLSTQVSLWQLLGPSLVGTNSPSRRDASPAHCNNHSYGTKSLFYNSHNPNIPMVNLPFRQIFYALSTMDRGVATLNRKDRDNERKRDPRKRD